MVGKIQFGNFDFGQKNFIGGGTEEPKKNFGDFMKESFNDANALKLNSDAVTNDFLTGRTDNLHEVMIAGQKAEVAITFVTEVRNRVVEGYQEFMRMQM